MATRFDVSGVAPTTARDRCGCEPLARALRLVARAVIVLAAALTSAACGGERTYTAEPIAARIVDADTGAPVEGVNVVAAWQAKGGLEGGNIMGYVTVMEDVTNANGEFSFPGWGPKRWSNGAIRDGAPLLILFKPGYDAALLWESKYGVEFAPSHLSSSWNGMAIPLKKYEGSLDLYDQYLSGLRTFVSTLLRKGACEWKSMPRALATIDQLHRSLAAANVFAGLPSLDAMESLADKSCGSLKTYVLEHGQ
jgi:hypothetical protein